MSLPTTPMSDKYNADLMLRVAELQQAYEQMRKAICRYNSPNKDKALEKLREALMWAAEGGPSGT